MPTDLSHRLAILAAVVLGVVLASGGAVWLNDQLRGNTKAMYIGIGTLIIIVVILLLLL